MIDFEPIRIEHKTLFAEAYAAEPTMSSGDSFGCVYLWDLLCRRNVAWLDGRLGVEYRCPRGVFYVTRRARETCVRPWRPLNSARQAWGRRCSCADWSRRRKNG